MPRKKSLTAAVDAAIADMTWLTPADAAAVALARDYAARIENDPPTGKALGWMGPHLLNTLRSLGGTPGDRKALGVDHEVKSKLGELRKLRGA